MLIADDTDGGPVAAEQNGLRALTRAAALAFAGRFGVAPRWLAAAPGRVNLIGEHTDYSGGFALPMAIDRHTVIAGGPVAGPTPAEARPRLRFHSASFDATQDVSLDEVPRAGEPRWANYVRGVVAGFQERGLRPPSLDALALSDIPLGGGLSSSASLEVAAATLLEAATGVALDSMDKARLCRQAEHDYAHVPCGLMDQMTAVLGQESGPLLLDFEAERARPVPIADASVRVLICNSNVRHSLGDGEYAKRRRDCEEAARILGQVSLRGATIEAVEAARDALGSVVYRRARHVVSENARTLAAADALAMGDVGAAGTLMYQSHASLRDDFEVSCGELDTLVEIAGEVGVAGGVLGARMTGGGFGGCTVMLVRADRVASIIDALTRAYRSRHGRALTAFLSRPARGAHLVALEKAP
ncbi:MAG TPA: galactokinase [Polyangia bacterium]|jgi:galactokinase|nr:galactokinase [Polyangia bacterium]